jgi:mannose-6-phosphate isomerase-like protein (cupin superfamily)
MSKKTLRFAEGFRVIPGNARSQAAEMVLPPGDKEGDPKNRHRGADQWLFVVAGTGVARVDGRRHALSRGTLLLIEKGERHEIENTGRGLLRTLNFYVPPAYTKGGEPNPRGRRGTRRTRHED